MTGFAWAGTGFQSILPDSSVIDSANVERLLFVCGKFYYELVKERDRLRNARPGVDRISFLRIEEICPFPHDAIAKALKSFSNCKGFLLNGSSTRSPSPPILVEFIWVQEEPQNMGAYTFIQPRLCPLLPSDKKVFSQAGERVFCSPSSAPLPWSQDHGCTGHRNIQPSQERIGGLAWVCLFGFLIFFN